MPAEPSPEVLAEVRLSAVRGVGPLLRRRLIEAFGTAQQILSANPERLRSVRGIGAKVATSIAEAPTEDSACTMLEHAASAGIRVLTLSDDEYPPGLREIPDPPAVIYCRGEILQRDARAVAIVGTRRATRYGLRQTELLTHGLAEAGVTIVSGLARGVDGVAHRAALQAGGRTLAALAGGLLKIYPPEHDKLANEVAASGALLAEAPPPMPPMSGSFPQRNRIISGLSLGVVVIEAAHRSGALITVRHAAEQGRDAFALPGPVDAPQSAGTNKLIQEGAKLVTCVDDILEELESATVLSTSHRTHPSSPSSAGATEHWEEPMQTLLAAITSEPTSVDELVDTTELPVEQVLAGLSRLEAGGAVRRVSGALVSRA